MLKKMSSLCDSRSKEDVLSGIEKLEDNSEASLLDSPVKDGRNISGRSSTNTADLLSSTALHISADLSEGFITMNDDDGETTVRKNPQAWKDDSNITMSTIFSPVGEQTKEKKAGGENLFIDRNPETWQDDGEKPVIYRNSGKIALHVDGKGSINDQNISRIHDTNGSMDYEMLNDMSSVPTSLRTSSLPVRHHVAKTLFQSESTHDELQTSRYEIRQDRANFYSRKKEFVESFNQVIPHKDDSMQNNSELAKILELSRSFESEKSARFQTGRMKKQLHQEWNTQTLDRIQEPNSGVDRLQLHMENMMRAPLLPGELPHSGREFGALRDFEENRHSIDSNTTEALLRGLTPFEGETSHPYHRFTGTPDLEHTLEHMPFAQSFTSSAPQERHRLLDEMEKEMHRRKHCEKQISELQQELLEMQQQLAVTRATEKKKDSLISHLHKTMNRIATQWKQKDDEKVKALEKLKNDQNELDQENQQQHQLLAQREQVLLQLQTECEKLRKAEEDLQNQLQQVQEEASVEIKETQQEKELCSEQMEKIVEEKVAAEHQLKNVQKILAKEREDWHQEEAAMREKLDLLERKLKEQLKLSQGQAEKESKEAKTAKEKLQKMSKVIENLREERDRAVVEKETAILDLNLHQAQFETKLQKQDADWKQQVERTLNERLGVFQAQAKKREDSLQDLHQKELREAAQRQKMQVMKQQEEQERVLGERQKRFSLAEKDYQAKLAQCHQEISRLTAQCEKYRKFRSNLGSQFHSLQQGMMRMLDEVNSPHQSDTNQEMSQHVNSHQTSMVFSQVPSHNISFASTVPESFLSESQQLFQPHVSVHSVMPTQPMGQSNSTTSKDAPRMHQTAPNLTNSTEPAWSVYAKQSPIKTAYEVPISHHHTPWKHMDSGAPNQSTASQQPLTLPWQDVLLPTSTWTNPASITIQSDASRSNHPPSKLNFERDIFPRGLSSSFHQGFISTDEEPPFERNGGMDVDISTGPLDVSARNFENISEMMNERQDKIQLYLKELLSRSERTNQHQAYSEHDVSMTPTRESDSRNYSSPTSMPYSSNNEFTAGKSSKFARESINYHRNSRQSGPLVKERVAHPIDVVDRLYYKAQQNTSSNSQRSRKNSGETRHRKEPTRKSQEQNQKQRQKKKQSHPNPSHQQEVVAGQQTKKTKAKTKPGTWR